MTDTTITPPVQVPQLRPPVSTRRWPLRAAAVGYSAVWIIGLFLTSSTTTVTSSGSAVVRQDAPHVAALTLQFLLTEGVAALALLIVVIGVWRPTARGVARSAALISGVAAVVISLVQTVLGVCLVEIAVRGGDTALASSLSVTLNELDGVKMFLLAATAFAISAAQWRRQVRLPIWLLPAGIATGVALLASAIGYLARSNTFSIAAWISLPLLLIFVTAVGLCVRPGSERDAKGAER
ncbi:hypothetical protein SAMN04515671_1619 [Nakamurella panacisegetis]|uniref:DUF4386 domain-containing protein n=1 Tax=Nakamurella panacisegetis TaxID=1090615 RepID=A0A1H0LCM1_9ACTN|nr:hypothetical protein [Nakamurella panacisegetis]SDO65999.1 hypothetical protein SAMN04515671_1619 [Nakamurella panacisegetis]